MKWSIPFFSIQRALGLCLCLLILFLPFSKAAIEIFASLAFVLAAAGLFAKQERPAALKDSRFRVVLVIVGAYVMWMLLSAVLSADPAHSFRVLVSKYLEDIGIFLVMAVFLADKGRRRTWFRVLLLSSLVLWLDCIWQFFTGHDLLRHYALEAGRLTGTLKMPNDLAAYACVLALVWLAVVLFGKGARRYWAILPALIGHLVLLATWTRGAWVGWFAGLLLLLALRGRKVLISALGFLAALLFLMPLTVQERLFSAFMASAPENDLRRALWSASVAMIRDSPWTGQGLGVFMARVQDFLPPGDHYISYAHNCYLQTAAEIGLAGLILFSVLLAWVLVQSLRLCLRQGRAPAPAEAGILSGVLAFCLHSATDTNLYSLSLAMLFWILLGYLLAATLDTEKEERNPG
ncbi:MAG: O-antigen ligase family protein [Candidatus Omnitrophica bacterium]|nr:O-antigen ligase family protein [Candidatus Omnitrophota bacterium]